MNDLERAISLYDAAILTLRCERLAEASTLEKLDRIKQTLIDLDQSTAQVDYEQALQPYAVRLKQLSDCHHQRKQKRHQQRIHYNNVLQGSALTAALDELDQESRQDGMERRQLRRERDEAIAPFVATTKEISHQIQALKQMYQALSHQWQAQLQSDYVEQNANTGLFVPILYESNGLIVVDKPAGLLAVPGRRYDSQDSVMSRLRLQRSKHVFLKAVHRLDRDTSGVMAIATSASVHAALSQQFARRQVHKVYEAILSQPIKQHSGNIKLPLWSNPKDRPRQDVDFQLGKPSRTDFKVLVPGDFPRVELIPHTGRTHQLRVHMAHPKGLNSPILGDTLYGTAEKSTRLYLHAVTLTLTHPVTGERLLLRSCYSDLP